MPLTLTGWTSPRIAEAFVVREDTVRLWRSDFASGSIAALKASVAPGPVPVKSETALRVVTPLLEQPMADRRNWTIPRLCAEIESREGVRISRSHLSKALRKKVPLAAAAAHAEGAPDRPRGRSGRPALVVALTAGRSRGHCASLWRRERGVDASPLARAWAKMGADLRVPAPGQAKKVAMLESLDHVTREVIVHTSPTKRSSDFVAHLEQLDRVYGPRPGQPTKPVVLVEDNGPIHTSKFSLAALAAHAYWLTVERLPKYAPELNDIGMVWHDLKANQLAHQTFAYIDALDRTIRQAVDELNAERMRLPLAKPRISA
jgi:transposase